MFSLSPTTIDDQGILQESFNLLLLGYAALFSGIVSLVIEFVKKQ
ncbi:MAG: hypothetical protein RIS53_585 [Bacillota bacterium]|jgi:hypothetical protein